MLTHVVFWTLFAACMAVFGWAMYRMGFNEGYHQGYSYWITPPDEASEQLH
jgi:hypothetical protein